MGNGESLYPAAKVWKVELLVAGECAEKTIRQELTYNELDSSIENLWSVLFMTGYLTQQGKAEGRRLRLVIPNQEIHGLFVSQIQEWFRETVRQDRAGLTGFCEALKEGNAKEVERRFNTYLSKTISICGSFVRKAKKENDYHGILTGLLSSKETWIVRSNAESGEGYRISL